MKDASLQDSRQQDYIAAYQQVSYAYRHGNFEVTTLYLVREPL